MGLRKIGGSLAIESTTIWENSDPPWPHIDCGGLCVDYVDVDISNSIIWNHEAETISDWGSTLDIEWCDISGGWPGDGNIDADPLFCNEPCTPTDLSLSRLSPCRNAGRNGADIGAGGMGCEEPYVHTARTIHVPSDQATIADAIDAGCEGDTVLIAAGAYFEGDLEFQRRNIVVRGEKMPRGIDDDEVAVVDARDHGYGFRFMLDEGSDTELSRLVIANARGRGIVAAVPAAPTIENCIVRGNRGGGIECQGASEIRGCIVTGNSADAGGGISIPLWEARPQIINCVIENNVASVGGGLYISQSEDGLVENCVIRGNVATAGSNGGGGGFFGAHWYTFDVANSIIWDNSPNQIGVFDSVAVAISHSNVMGGWPGEGNIDADPLFATWHGRPSVLRPASPCIDSGDPMSGSDGIDWPPRYDNDPARADMGAYGGPGADIWLP
ncbi:MAG: hypothetical protein CME06_16775 [Gemmatimonadetes bacterium]|nr:hypothetical protein [Gemmatimonadota bacterium]